jgi:hypothetical protein
MRVQMDRIVKLFAVVIIGLLLLGFFSKVEESSRYAKQLIEYNNEAQEYKDKNDKLVSYNTTLEVNRRDLLRFNDSLRKELNDLKIKKPTSITKFKTVTEIDSVYVYFSQKLPCDTFKYDFTYAEEWFSLNGTITDTNLLLSNLLIPNDWSVIVGEKKNGLFKRNEKIVAITATNPYIKTTQINNYSIKPNTPFHDKLWFKAALLATGFVIGKAL